MAHTSGERRGMCRTVVTVLGGLFALIVGLPIFLAAMSFVVAMIPLSALYELWASRRDSKLLATSPVQYVVAGSGSRPPVKLAVRWTLGSDPALPPVAIPNGLGATLISISRLHELLVELGFSVLSYDRAGVGLSGALPRGIHHYGAKETVEDMHAVLTHPSLGLASGTRWILIGPSMGSIVAQCYIAAHPEHAAGFLNLDGFPFPFAARRRRFELASWVYRVYENIMWTGMLRPFLWLATSQFSFIASKAFPVGMVRAQMGQARFFGSLAREMFTMMDCADCARDAWGPAFDLQTFAADKLLPLINSQPAAYGETRKTDDGKASWNELPRSAYEQGGDEWTPIQQSRSAVEQMLEAHKASGSTAPLPAAWGKLVVRCMTSRNYNFPGGKRFYDDQMKDWSASEHSLHALLAADGARTGFPTHHHGTLFFGTVEFAAAQTLEIARAVLKARAA